MTALAITAVEIPPAPDGGTATSASGSPDGATDFHDCHALREAHELEKWGNLDRCPTLLEDMEYLARQRVRGAAALHRTAGRETVGIVLGDAAPARKHRHRRDRRPGGARLPAAGLGTPAAGTRGSRGRRAGAGRPWTATVSCRPELVDRADRLLPAKSGAGGLPRMTPPSPSPPPPAMSWSRWSGPAASPCRSRRSTWRNWRPRRPSRADGYDAGGLGRRLPGRTRGRIRRPQEPDEHRRAHCRAGLGSRGLGPGQGAG